MPRTGGNHRVVDRPVARSSERFGRFDATPAVFAPDERSRTDRTRQILPGSHGPIRGRLLDSSRVAWRAPAPRPGRDRDAARGRRPGPIPLRLGRIAGGAAASRPGPPDPRDPVEANTVRFTAAPAAPRPRPLVGRIAGNCRPEGQLAASSARAGARGSRSPSVATAVNGAGGGRPRAGSVAAPVGAMRGLAAPSATMPPTTGALGAVDLGPVPGTDRRGQPGDLLPTVRRRSLPDGATGRAIASWRSEPRRDRLSAWPTRDGRSRVAVRCGSPPMIAAGRCCPFRHLPGPRRVTSKRAREASGGRGLSPRRFMSYSPKTRSGWSASRFGDVL